MNYINIFFSKNNFYRHAQMPACFQTHKHVFSCCHTCGKNLEVKCSFFHMYCLIFTNLTQEDKEYNKKIVVEILYTRSFFIHFPFVQPMTIVVVIHLTFRPHWASNTLSVKDCSLLPPIRSIVIFSARLYRIFFSQVIRILNIKWFSTSGAQE